MTDLLKYANHLTNCRYRGGHDCDCGLDEIREAHRTGTLAQAVQVRNETIEECARITTAPFGLAYTSQRHKEVAKDVADQIGRAIRALAAQPPAAPVETKSQAKEPEANDGVCDRPPAMGSSRLASRRSEAATSEMMDVTSRERPAPHPGSSAGNAVPADLIGDIDYAIQCARVFKASTAIDWLESMRRKYTALAATEPQAAPTREDVAFEFYRFSHPNRWDCPRADVRNDFNNCRGSATWDRCIRSADATLALSRPERGTP